MTYDIKPGAVIHGDCLTVLRQMEPGSVDMVITDPPYGVDYQSTRAAKENRREKISNDRASFIWWIYDAFRVLKEGGEHCVSAVGMSSRFSWTRCASPVSRSSLCWSGTGCTTAWAT